MTGWHPILDNHITHRRLAECTDFSTRVPRVAAAGTVALTLTTLTPNEVGAQSGQDELLARAAAAGRLRRNFQGYTDDAAGALIDFGASAISGSSDSKSTFGTGDSTGDSKLSSEES